MAAEHHSSDNTVFFRNGLLLRLGENVCYNNYTLAVLAVSMPKKKSPALEKRERSTYRSSHHYFSSSGILIVVFIANMELGSWIAHMCLAFP